MLRYTLIAMLSALVVALIEIDRTDLAAYRRYRRLYFYRRAA